jgi:hypothetical protein
MQTGRHHKAFCSIGKPLLAQALSREKGLRGCRSPLLEGSVVMCADLLYPGPGFVPVSKAQVASFRHLSWNRQVQKRQTAANVPIFPADRRKATGKRNTSGCGVLARRLGKTTWHNCRFLPARDAAARWRLKSRSRPRRRSGSGRSGSWRQASASAARWCWRRSCRRCRGLQRPRRSCRHGPAGAGSRARAASSATPGSP